MGCIGRIIKIIIVVVIIYFVYMAIKSSNENGTSVFYEAGKVGKGIVTDVKSGFESDSVK